MKTAVVTGTSYGLGKSIAKTFLADGFKVYGVNRTEGQINNDNFVWIKADLYNDEDISSVFEKIEEENINLLVNNAGTAILEKATKFSDGNFNKTFDLNFKAPIKLVLALLPKLQKGLIINISSDSDRFTDELHGFYSASKAALNMYFDSISSEKPSIKIINMLPSFIDTPLLRRIYDGRGLPRNKTMKPERVAESVMYMFNNQEKIESGTRVIVMSDNLKEDLVDPEKLYYYNVDTREFNKLK